MSSPTLTKEEVLAMGFDAALRKLLMVFMPDTLEDVETINQSLCHNFGVSVGIEAALHVLDHQGHACAKELLEKYPEALGQMARQYYFEKLADANLSPQSDTNAATTQEILDEMSEVQDRDD